jgi:dihydrofolate reductase
MGCVALAEVDRSQRHVVGDDLDAVIRGLKETIVGEIEVGGPDLARSLTKLGLIDEYRIYFHPVVPGGGTPYFADSRPSLRFVASEPVGEGGSG